MEETKRVVVVGGGSFGTALATMAGRKGHQVVLLMRDDALASSLNTSRRNERYFPDILLPETVSASTNAKESLLSADLIILALPAQTVVSFLEENQAHIRKDTLLCNSAKGLYLKENCLLSEAIPRALGRDQPYCVLSGPSFAAEMMQNRPTAVVAASVFLYHAVSVQRALSSSTFKVFTSQDLLGVQLGGSLKNPLAIGAGIIEGLGLGINTMAFYITRCSIELMELCKAMGGDPSTISGLSGIGDLMLTCFGEQSRNRTCGSRLAAGESIADITANTTVEGVFSAKVAVTYADACGLKLPIFRTVAAILAGEMTIQEAENHLMELPLSKERVTK